MMDFQQARINMVDCQVRTNDITDHAVLNALLSVQREEFTPRSLRDFAYVDSDISLDELGGEGRYMMDPAQFARLLQLAKIGSDDIVLEIGCGSGYTTAVLANLCNSVVAIENNEKLAEFASNKLTDQEIFNAVVICDPLQDGYAKEAPYDVVFVCGAVDELSQAIFDQLKENGRVVAVNGTGNAAHAKIYEKSSAGISEKTEFNCSVKPLPGFEKAVEFVF